MQYLETLNIHSYTHTNICSLLCQGVEVVGLKKAAMCYQEREAAVNITGFGKPNRIYDAILPLRILFLKLTNIKVYR